MVSTTPFRVVQLLKPSLTDWAGRAVQKIPPATNRNLWLLVASLVAFQNVAVFQSSQSEHITVFAALVWGGAVICMEDLIEALEPRPGWLGLMLGSCLLIWVIFRSAQILYWDGLLYLLAPLAGLALVFLCKPISQIKLFKDSLICLLMLPAFNLIMKLIPEKPVSIMTANLAGFWLSILGFDNVVKDVFVMMPTGGVEVMPACNGLDTIAQVICVCIIFLLAFPIRSRMSRTIVIAAAPLIGLAINTIRIAVLALCVANGNGKGSGLFTFFHDDLGSLLFSGIAVFVFGMLYMNLLERELPPLPGKS